MRTISDPQEAETVEWNMAEGIHLVGYVGTGYFGRRGFDLGKMLLADFVGGS